jgi:hypothetical protein
MRLSRLTVLSIVQVRKEIYMERFGRRRYDVFENTEGLRKTTKTSVRIVGDSAEIRIGNLWNTKEGCHLSDNGVRLN